MTRFISGLRLDAQCQKNAVAFRAITILCSWAAKNGVSGEGCFFREDCPQGLKPKLVVVLTARLKSCP